MSQLIIRDLVKSVGDKLLFNHLSFHLESGMKVGLLGINGAGKSTLLKIIAGVEEADEVVVEKPNQYRIAYLSQQTLIEHTSIMDYMFDSDAPILQLNRNYEQTVQRLQQDPSNEVIQNELFQIQQQMDQLDAWEINSLAKTALTKLGMINTHQTISSLSGGQQKRVALAKVLIEPCDLLILDEPTNHLDRQAINWLEEQLTRMTNAVLFVTHDRYFLDHVATHIIELENAQLFSYTGNYESYLESKEIREQNEQAANRKNASLYRQELKWIRRGAKARTTKQKARIDRFETLQNKVDQPSSTTSMQMDLASSRLGKTVLEGKDVSKQFGEKQIVKQFDFLVQNEDRIGIVGKNGAGKSTILNMLAGKILPDEGTIERGQTIRVAHYEQLLPEMDESMRILDFIKESSNAIVQKDGSRLSASQMLENFLFPSHTHGTKIGSLSGGERKRLYLLKLLAEQPNVLLLDEPTNDLDIKTISILENYLESFPGVIITISHDPFFLDRIVKKLWVVDNGQVAISLLPYSEFMESDQLKPETVIEKETTSPPMEKEKKRRLSYHEKKEWEALPERIQKTEQKIEEAETNLARAGSNYDDVRKWSAVLEDENNNYEQLLERFYELEEIVQNA